MDFVSCDRKIRYRTEAGAKAALRKMKRAVVNNSRLEIYHCLRHNGWHIGNRPRRLAMLSDIEQADKTIRTLS